MSQHIEIFVALAAPFLDDEMRTRRQNGREFQYITARMVMNRLDEVLGPANWWDDYEPIENAIVCRLTLRLPDGVTLTKCDAAASARRSTRASTKRADSPTPSSGRR